MKRLGLSKIIGSFGKRMLLYMPLMITCRQFEDFIIDYLEGDLAARKRFEFELHLKTCNECRNYLAAYNRVVEVTAKTNNLADSEVSLPELPEDLIKAIIKVRKLDH